jgi:hypothetical protein
MFILCRIEHKPKNLIMETITNHETVVVSTSKIKTLQVLNFLFFIIMVTMNTLAVVLPLNGKSTKELSDKYPNLFVPAGITFSIWSVIYLALLIFCIYQVRSLFSKKPEPHLAMILNAIGYLFILNATFNALWIVAWHYEILPLSIVFMIGILGTLIQINKNLRPVQPYISGGIKVIVKASFGLYLGWICIATIANVTAILVAYGIMPTGFSGQSWTCIMVLVGSIIGFITTINVRNGFVGLAIIWALIGIIIARNNDIIYYKYIVYSAAFGILMMISAMLMASTIQMFTRKKVIVED